MDGKTTYKCSVCEKIFSKKSNFQRHYNNIHQKTKLQEIFICHHCEKQFKSKFNLIRHFSTCRKYSESRFQVSKRVKCALCNYENSRQTLLQHYNEQHGVNISTECMDFSNFHEFEKWKNETEKSNTSKYIRYASKKSESRGSRGNGGPLSTFAHKICIIVQIVSKKNQQITENILFNIIY
jgi:uncharacterized C2H2 Zn-finger protein